MRKIYTHLSRMLVLLVMLAMMPIYAFGATETMTYDSITNFDIGNNYDLTVKMGDEIWVYSYGDYGYYADLQSVTSSNPTVATTTLDGSECFMLKAKTVGSTTITARNADGRQSLIYVTVKPGKATIESYYWIYKHTKTVTVKATNVVKGDKIKLKIGKKTYTKKVTKTAKNYKIKIKIKKPGFYGKKYRLALMRKGKTVAKEIDYVYLSNYVHVGDSKKKVRWLTNWNDPDEKNYTAYTEQWCYDWSGDGLNDAYLYFRDGKVTNWQIYN